MTAMLCLASQSQDLRSRRQNGKGEQTCRAHFGLPNLEWGPRARPRAGEAEGERQGKGRKSVRREEQGPQPKQVTGMLVRLAAGTVLAVQNAAAELLPVHSLRAHSSARGSDRLDY